MSVDLHIHSTASDGTVAPAAIVEAATVAGLDAIALCDHDSVDGVAEAMHAGRDFGITVIPGVELSAETDGMSVHILGYFIDHTDPELARHLDTLRDVRLERARAIVQVLAEGGYDLRLDDVLRFTNGGSVGRAHVAMALVDAGLVPTMSAAFSRLLGRGRPFYVPKPVPEPECAIATIRNAGGLAVLAHPGVSKTMHLVDRLQAAGLEGIEAYHVQHTVEERARYAQAARDRCLVVTGGSDFHSAGEGRPRLGDGGLPAGALPALLVAAGERVHRAEIAG
jgi:predicted metal-dependent phosphoesterase TrpH